MIILKIHQILIGNQKFNLKPMTCKYCNSTSLTHRLRLYDNKLRRNDLDPKWLPHIQLMCVTCGRYQETMKQTEALRQKLDGMTLADIDYEGIKGERIGEIQAKIPNE